MSGIRLVFHGVYDTSKLSKNDRTTPPARSLTVSYVMSAAILFENFTHVTFSAAGTRFWSRNFQYSQGILRTNFPPGRGVPLYLRQWIFFFWISATCGGKNYAPLFRPLKAPWYSSLRFIWTAAWDCSKNLFPRVGILEGEFFFLDFRHAYTAHNPHNIFAVSRITRRN